MAAHAGRVRADHVRRLLAAEGLRAIGWENVAGDRYGAHEHGYDKVLVTLHGSIRYVLGGDAGEVELRAGDRLHLPAGTVHTAIVGPDGVGCLEAHVPAGTLGALPERIAGWARSRRLAS